MRKANVGNQVKKCESFKRQIADFDRYVNSYADSEIGRANLQTRMEGLHTEFAKFKEIQIELDYESFVEISEQFYNAIAKAKVKQDQFKINIPQPSTEIVLQDSSAPSTSSSYQHSVIPTKEIPHFSGNIEDWAKFKKKIEQIIHSNSRLSNTQKLQFLKQYLHGEAADVIPVDETNYEVAWKYLVDRFDSKRDLILHHTNLLLKTLPMPDNSLKSMCDLATDMNNHVHCLKELSLSWSNIADHLLTSIAVSRMKEGVRQRWEQMFTEMPCTFTATCKFLRQEYPYLLETHRETRNRPHRSPPPKRPRYQ